MASVCVCVCVWLRERRGERMASVCVKMCVRGEIIASSCLAVCRYMSVGVGVGVMFT